MEMNWENKASKGAAATGIALGGSALGVSLLNGGLGALFGGRTAGCAGDHMATRYDLEQQKAIVDRDAEIAYLKGRDAAKTDSLEMYKYFDGRIRGIEGQLAQQAVYNATNNATVSCISGQVAQLMALTKTVIPINNICPEPMARYNSWAAPTADAAAGA